MQVNILEAKNRLSQLIKAALAGEEVVIANRGEPVARLVRADDAGGVSPGNGSGLAIIEWLGKNPPPPSRRQSHEEIEAGMREERAAWE